MKSKKKTKKDYSSQEVDDLGKSFIIMDEPKKKVIKRMPLGKGFRTIVKDSMIDRKATQLEIDIDKQIREMLDTGHYNHNQIASMVRGANLERVKKIRDERRKT